MTEIVLETWLWLANLFNHQIIQKVKMKKPRKFKWLKKVILIFILIIIVGLVVIFNYHTSVTKNLDDFIYELPFKKGSKYKVLQGYGGLFTHQYTAALDFEMPVGSPIYAARSGIVYSFKENSDEGGIFSKYKNKANYIIIKHDDGSFGCYWHLQKNGVLVKKGKVKAGQQIGISGATGQSFRPHLHFSVKKRLTLQMDSFVKTKFKSHKSHLHLC